MATETFESINKISKDFYKIFQSNTEKSYRLAKDLNKYVLHQTYSYLVAVCNLELTFEQWLKKNKHIK